MSACVWCQTVEAEHLLPRRDRFSGRLFHYLRCRRCGLIRLEAVLSWPEKAAYYPPAYEAYADPPRRWPFRLGWRRYWQRRIGALRRFLPLAPGSVLDIGCATGGFLEAMKERGWQVAGVEPNAEAAARARARLGEAAVQARPLEEAVFPTSAFDLITLWDVLDHLPDPPSALRRLAGWLRPGGLLVVGVPHLRSWDARLFGTAWLGWDAPRHMYLFPEDTLRDMLQGTGFRVVSARCFYGGYGSWAASLDFWLEERLGQRRMGRFLRWAAALRLWRYLTWPYFRLAEWAGRGPIRAYICRRESADHPP